jgi:hypothetical protein
MITLTNLIHKKHLNNIIIFQQSEKILIEHRTFLKIKRDSFKIF